MGIFTEETVGKRTGRLRRLLSEQEAYFHRASAETANGNLRMLRLATAAGSCLLLPLLILSRLLLGRWEAPAGALLLLAQFAVFHWLAARSAQNRTVDPSEADRLCSLFCCSLSAILSLASLTFWPQGGPVMLGIALLLLPSLFLLRVQHMALNLLLSAALYLVPAALFAPETAREGIFLTSAGLLCSEVFLLHTLSLRMRALQFFDGSNDVLCPELWSKAAFASRCRAFLSDPRSHGCALFILDLDHFKAVNDQFGHLTGDRLLSAAAKALRENVRDRDSVCRFGGDEFCVLLTEPLSKPLLESRAVAFLAALTEAARPIVPEGITCSIGVAPWEAPKKVTYEQLFDAADKALYTAKNRGRNRFSVASGGTEANNPVSPDGSSMLQ